jgi:hypothetical protein
MQPYTVYLYLETAVHVSGGTSAHHLERIQLYLQHLVLVTPLLLPAPGSNNGLGNGQSPHGYINQTLQTQFRAPDDELKAEWEMYHFPLSLVNGRSPHGYINRTLQTQFRAPDDERCAARNMLSL